LDDRDFPYKQPYVVIGYRLPLWLDYFVVALGKFTKDHLNQKLVFGAAASLLLVLGVWVLVTDKVSVPVLGPISPPFSKE
jgi:hypothetical protein